MRNIIYPEEYFTIIINAINRGLTKKSAKQLGIGGQIHHIIPKCVAPELEKEKSNMVFLTYEEHYRVHKILAEANPNDNISYAWSCMSMKKETKEFFTEEDYSKAMKLQTEQMSGDKNISKRQDVRKKQSENHADFSGPNNPMFGKHHSDSAKEKSRLVNIGRKKPENAGRQPLSLFTLEYPDIVFNSYHEATDKAKLLGWIGVSVAGISNIFNAGRKSCGKDEKGNKLHWVLVQ